MKFLQRLDSFKITTGVEDSLLYTQQPDEILHPCIIQESGKVILLGWNGDSGILSPF
jgi:hypothetical protein